MMKPHLAPTRSRRLRRTIAAILVVAGAALLLMAPTEERLGLIAFALGVLLEGVGLVLDRRDPR
jgi:hypothetical protein